MLKIMVCEGDEVLVLNNVNEMSQDDFTTKMYDCLNEFESNMISDLVYEGIVMNDEDMKEFSGVVRECSFEDYIKDLKEYFGLCVDDEG